MSELELNTQAAWIQVLCLAHRAGLTKRGDDGMWQQYPRVAKLSNAGSLQYLLYDTLGNLHVLHRDGLLQVFQAVNVLDLTDKLHTAKERAQRTKDPVQTFAFT